MRIDINQTSSTPIELEKSSNSNAAQNTQSSSSGSIVDRASLNSDSTNVQALTQQALSVPDVRQDKVEQIKQQVQSGTYDFSPASTAKAIKENGF